MRLITFEVKGKKGVGAVIDNGVVDLSARMGVSSARHLIAENRISAAEEIASSAAPDYRLDEIKLGLPIEDPAKILCIGVNYMNRNAEYKDGSEAPKYPSVFMRTPLSLVPHGEPVVIPRESSQLDYEGEIVLVIGKAGRRIPQAEAMQHVAGISIMNEGSVSDWLRHGKFNVTQGKNFDRSGSMGPWIETNIGALDMANLRIETRVNGEIRQSDTTASMVFPFPRIIEYVSTFCTLLPGDLISTGTPAGSGSRLDPPRWLREGDVVEVTVAGVGTLRNTVIRE
jgi:2-keto-4-pentenoate hydratase/2-oxohepta-3-ene-1,7-dioic acid hydratase in catechol pathway